AKALCDGLGATIEGGHFRRSKGASDAAAYRGATKRTGDDQRARDVAARRECHLDLTRAEWASGSFTPLRAGCSRGKRRFCGADTERFARCFFLGSRCRRW